MAIYVLRPNVVAQCIQELRQLRIHQNFAGYLCMKHASAQHSTTSRLRVSFRDFFDHYFKVEGTNPVKPYIVLFTNGAPSEANLWFNKNVAGSYAPSSLREDNPFKQTVAIERTEGRPKEYLYSLKAKHWELASTDLTYGQRVPVVPLAAVLYRDYGFEGNPPSATDLISAFREQFGYSSSDSTNQTEFTLLFSDDSATDTREGWFELLT